MTEDAKLIAEIEARHANDEQCVSGFIPQAEALHEDRAALLAIVRRQREEQAQSVIPFIVSVTRILGRHGVSVTQEIAGRIAFACACLAGAMTDEQRNRANAAEDNLEAAERREAALREALQDIAKQKLHAEITDSDPDELDWLGGYEGCVKRARKALAAGGNDE